MNDLLLSSIIEVLYPSGLLQYRVHDHSGDECSEHDVQILTMRYWPYVATRGCVPRTVTENKEVVS